MSEINSSQTLTLSAHLLSVSAPEQYAAATRHTFLTQAGTGTLPLARLALWLAQDRIYAAHAYPRFIGALIASIPFSAADGVAAMLVVDAARVSAASAGRRVPITSAGER